LLCLFASLVRLQRRWLTVLLPAVVTGAALVVAGIAVWLRQSGTVTDHYPPSFIVWAFAVFVALAAAPVGFRSAAWWRRAAALAAVPLTASAAFLLVNSHYGYWPTLGDLLGRPFPYRMDG